MRALPLFTATLSLALLSACASTVPLRVMAPGQPTPLAPNEQASLPDGSRLRYIGVGADSRCPPNVQCIRAGDADVMFEHLPNVGAPRQVTLNLPEAPTARLGALELRILALEFGPAPKATVRVDPVQP